MKLNKISEVWNRANRLLSDFNGLLSSKNFATIATWRNDFSFLLLVQFRSIALALPHVSESGKFCLLVWNAGKFACGIQNPGLGIWIIARGIQNPTNDWNQKPVPGIRNPLCGIQIPRLLGSLTWGELVRGKGKVSRTRARPREEKAPPFPFICFPPHALF